MTTKRDNQDLLSSLSPAKRAMVLKALKEEALKAQKPPIVHRTTGRDPVPLSLAQSRLWLFSQLRPGSPAYNEVSSLRVEGSLDVPVLERSLQEIMRRHEALRTTFSTVEGKPVQVISPAHVTKLHVVDLGGLSEHARSAELQRLTEEEARRPFELTQGPLLRTTLFQLGEQRSVLMVTAHHIVLDGWSIGVFQRELAELYKAFSQGKPSPLDELPIQYADYSSWQRQWLRDDVLKRQLDYWVRQLSGMPPLLQLPFARPRPETETFAGATEYFKLDKQLSDELAALSRRANTSLFMTLLAGFQTLLYRYTNQTDIPIGTVVANREQPELEQLIGFFVNTLVLRGRLQDNPSFSQVLERVRDTALTAYEHQEIPFDHVVEALQPERSLSYNPLFQVMFILQNTPEHAFALPGLTLTPLQMASVTAKYDLTLSMEETPRGLTGHWEYNSDLFDTATIRRMSGHLETLLRAIVQAAERPISELPLLTAPEKQQLLVEWNQTDADFPRDSCIHQIFEAQAERTPEAIALEQAEQRLNYREVNQRANQVAHLLRERGVGPGTLVAVCLQRSVDMVVALLGVMKAGGTYVPLDPSYPTQRLSYMLEDSNVVVLLTHSPLRPRLSLDDAKVVCLDTDWNAISQRNPANPAPSAGPGDLAYIIYTSGSTGAPKGVRVSHRNLVHSTTARWAYYREPLASFLLLSSFAFDSSVAGIYWTLTQGGRLILPEGDGPPDISKLHELIATRHVSHLLCIPSVYSLVMQNAQPHELSSLRTVIVAGEPCPAQLVERHHEVVGSAALYNEYGPTEATVWSTVHKLEAKPPRGNVSIGRSIANTRIYILDTNLQPVPVGVPGELHVGGEGVAHGYLHRPELTEARFIPNPFSVQVGERLYKTGDLARYWPDGLIEFMGRIDEQVKIRGYRIEPGEVEAVLQRHPAVLEAVVIARDDAQENKRLVAYLAVDRARTVSVSELRDFALEHLPGFSVPSAFVLVEEFPRLPNGKVDRKALPVQDEPREETPDTASSGWTGLQRTIATLWKETLGVQAVSLDDNFFKIGGDSLSIIRVFNRLRDAVGKSIAITDLFKHPTVRTLSEFLEK
jgi:amino acid adenylation domain-containing protein